MNHPSSRNMFRKVPSIKSLSIKTRVTLWYTALMTILLAAGLACIFMVSDRMLLQRYRTVLRSVVEEAVQQIRYDDGELDTDKVPFYKNEVSVFLYDEDGRIIAPRNSVRGYVNALLESGEIKVVEEAGESWMVYDLYREVGGIPVWFRGSCLISNVYGTFRMIRFSALLSVPLFLLASAGGGYLITRRAFRPIEQIRQTADAISDGGDLSRRIDTFPDSRDEVSQLAATFNRMFGRLQRSFDTEKQFTSDASHELRTPAAIIISQAEYALEHTDDPAETKEALETILRQSRRMSGLISQLLRLARADNGKISPEWEQVDLSELCAMVAEETEVQAEASGIRIFTDIQPGVVITADQSLLMRALDNLLQNAVHYNREAGTVSLSLCREGDVCTVRVADTGLGIPREELPLIWNRFYRASSSMGRSGTGLGLSMVKWILDVHHGSIQAESTEGEGSVFTMTLPVSRNV